MSTRRWSRGEKFLFLPPALILVGLVLLRLDVADREFRSDIAGETLRGWNPLRSQPAVARWENCETNLQSIQKAIAQYCRDNDGRFPPVRSNDDYYGWVRAIRHEGLSGWHCTLSYSSVGIIPWTPGNYNFTGYYLNSNLASVHAIDVLDPAHTILVGEGGGPTEPSNASYAKSNIPRQWLRDKNSPAFRHRENLVFARRGAYYLLANGQVQFITPKEFANQTYTFSLK